MDRSALPGIIVMLVIFGVCWLFIAVAFITKGLRRRRSRRGGHRKTGAHAGAARRRLQVGARGTHR
jgi:threonine/homoserine/homoserine lactone efflux protein